MGLPADDPMPGDGREPAKPMMRQEAPYPEILADLVERVRYREGWTFELNDLQRDQDHGRGESRGLTLEICVTCPDAYHPERKRSTVHYFIVPAATYDERSWRRWIFDRVLDVETHEACEFFVIMCNDFDCGDGLHWTRPQDRPYAPSHGPGNDPYTIRELATETDQRTSFRGTVNQ